MEFRDLIVSSLIVCLAIVMLITFTIKISDENGSNVTLANQPIITYVVGNISHSLNDSQAQADQQQKALIAETGETPIITVLGFYFKSVLSALSIFTKALVSLFLFLFTWPSVFGVDPIVSTTIMSVVIVSAVLLYWSVARAGR